MLTPAGVQYIVGCFKAAVPGRQRPPGGKDCSTEVLLQALDYFAVRLPRRLLSCMPDYTQPALLSCYSAAGAWPEVARMQVPDALWPAGLRVVTKLNKRRKLQIEAVQSWVEQIQGFLLEAVDDELDLVAFQDATSMQLALCAIDVGCEGRSVIFTQYTNNDYDDSQYTDEPAVLRPTEQSALICACEAERIRVTCNTRLVDIEYDDEHYANLEGCQTFITVSPM